MSADTLLRTTNLHARYGHLEVLHGIDIEIRAGEVVVVLGPNGAGKTSLLRSLAQAMTTSGEIIFDGHPVPRGQPHLCVRRGLALVPQGRGTITDLSVEDNLRVGGSNLSRSAVHAGIRRWYQVFPRLAERSGQQAGSLSGGEQQMLAIARAMMSRPRLLLLDEPSLGLAPLIVKSLFATLAELNASDGLAMLVVEQNASTVLNLADRVHVLESGYLGAGGPADEIRSNETLRRAYLGY